jgi:prophage regulatory protein
MAKIYEGPSLVRLPTVISATGYSRSTVYQLIAQGLWPKPVSIGPRAKAWLSSEIETLNAARIAGKTDEEIRKIVADLEEARKSYWSNSLGLAAYFSNVQPGAGSTN